MLFKSVNSFSLIFPDLEMLPFLSNSKPISLEYLFRTILTGHTSYAIISLLDFIKEETNANTISFTTGPNRGEIIWG